MSKFQLHIKIIGPAKSRKTSVMMTIMEALKSKGFDVGFTDLPDNDGNIQSYPRDLDSQYGEGGKVFIETVQTNRSEIAPLAKPSTLISLWKEFSKLVHDNALAKGFWPAGEPEQEAPQEAASKIALMHSELSEVLEAHRHKNPESEKIPGFSQMEEEMADLLIRGMDFSTRYRLRIIEAMLAKHGYNTGRPYKHGKEY